MLELHLHGSPSWRVTPHEAMKIQRKLASRVREIPLSHVPRHVGAVAVTGSSAETLRAAAILVQVESLDVLGVAIAESAASFPYIPGLLAFREAPVILRTLEQLPFLPDVLLFAGQGKAHPRRLGLASHLGVLLDHPTVGCAKSRLLGTQVPLPDEKGAWVPLIDREEVVGAAVRTRPGVKPVYVSVGHRITLPEAIGLVLKTTRDYRLPEPLRWARQLSRGTFSGLEALHAVPSEAHTSTQSATRAAGQSPAASGRDSQPPDAPPALTKEGH